MSFLILTYEGAKSEGLSTFETFLEVNSLLAARNSVSVSAPSSERVLANRKGPMNAMPTRWATKAMPQMAAVSSSISDERRARGFGTSVGHEAPAVGASAVFESVNQVGCRVALGQASVAVGESVGQRPGAVGCHVNRAEIWSQRLLAALVF